MFGSGPGGTGGSGAPPSATKLSPISFRAVLGGTGGSGAPPSAIRAGAIEFRVALGGTGGSGAPPSEYNLLPRCIIGEIEIIVEQPRSEAAPTNRIEHETFLKVIVFSLLEFGPWANLRILLAGCSVSYAVQVVDFTGQIQR